jgi:phospholipid-translocating ATPase
MGKVYEGDLVNDDGSDSASNPDGTPKSVASSDETTNVTVQPVQKETHIIPPASEVRPQIEEGESESAPKTKLSSQVLTRFKDSTLFTDIKAARSATYGSGFSTPGSSGGRDDPKDQYRSLKGFFSCLALCHTVLASTDPETGEIEYKAQSPDEAALVQAAADVGFVFQGRDRSTQVLKLRTPFGDHVEEYELLNVLDFTSSRKRMSVIVRSQDGKVIVFCKGADNVIFERLREGGDEIKAKTEEDLDKFANEGQ